MSENLDILYGIHAVMEALKSKKRNVVQLYVADNKAGHRAVEDIIRMAKRSNVKIDRMDVKMMDKLTKGANHQGVIAKAQPVRLMKLSTAIYEAEGKKDDLWLAVDEMTESMPRSLKRETFFGLETVQIVLRAPKAFSANKQAAKLSASL